MNTSWWGWQCQREKCGKVFQDSGGARVCPACGHNVLSMVRDDPDASPSPYGDDAERLREYAEKKYGDDGSHTRKLDPAFNGDAT